MSSETPSSQKNEILVFNKKYIFNLKYLENTLETLSN